MKSIIKNMNNLSKFYMLILMHWMKAFDIKVCSAPTTICKSSRSEQIEKTVTGRSDLQTGNRMARSDVLHLKNNKTDAAQSNDINASVKLIKPLGENINRKYAGKILKVFDTSIRRKLILNEYNVLSKKYFKNKIKKCFDQNSTSRIKSKYKKTNHEKNRSVYAICSKKTINNNVRYSSSIKNTNDEDNVKGILINDIPDKFDDYKDDIKIDQNMNKKITDNHNQITYKPINAINTNNILEIIKDEKTLKEKTSLDEQINILQSFTENQKEIERVNFNNTDVNINLKPNNCKPLMIQDVFSIVTKDFKIKFCKMTALKDFDIKNNLYFYDQSVHYKCTIKKCNDEMNITFKHIDIIQTITLDLVKELFKCCKSKNKNIYITTNLIFEKVENQFIFTFCYNTERILSKSELEKIYNDFNSNMIDLKNSKSEANNKNNRVQEYCTYRNLEKDRELDIFIMQIIKENIANYRNSIDIDKTTCFYDFTICKNISAYKTEIKTNSEPNILLDTIYNQKQDKEQNNATQYNKAKTERSNGTNEENKYFKLINLFITRLRAYIKNNEQGYDDLLLNSDKKDMQKNNKNDHKNKFDVIINTEDYVIEKKLQTIIDNDDQKNLDKINSKNIENINIYQNKKIDFQEEKIDQEKISKINDLIDNKKMHKNEMINLNDVDTVKNETNLEKVNNNKFCDLEKCKTVQFNDKNKKDDKKAEKGNENIILKNQENTESKYSEFDMNAENTENVSSSILNDIKTYERSSDNYHNISKQYYTELNKNKLNITESDLNAEQLEDISCSILHGLHELDQNSDSYSNNNNPNHKDDKLKNKKEQILQIEQNKKNILNACNEYKIENSNTNHLINDIVNRSNVLNFDYCSNQLKTSADVHKSYQKLETSNDTFSGNRHKNDINTNDNALIKQNDINIKPKNIISKTNKKNFKSQIPVLQRNQIKLFDIAKKDALTSFQEHKINYTSTMKNPNSFSKIPIKKIHKSKKIIIEEKTTNIKEDVAKYPQNLQRFKNENTNNNCLNQPNSRSISTKQNINVNEEKIPRKLYCKGKNNPDFKTKNSIEQKFEKLDHKGKKNAIETKKRINYIDQNKIASDINIDLKQKQVYDASDNTNKILPTYDRKNFTYQTKHTPPESFIKRETNDRQSTIKTDAKHFQDRKNRSDRNIKHMDSTKTYSYKRLNVVDNATIIRPTYNLKVPYIERLADNKKFVHDTHTEYLRNKQYGESSIISETIQNNFYQDYNELNDKKSKKTIAGSINQEDKRMVNSVIHAKGLFDKDKFIMNKKSVENYDLATNDKNDFSDGTVQNDADEYKNFLKNGIDYKHKGKIDKHYNANYIENNGLSNKLKSQNHIKKEITTNNTHKEEKSTNVLSKNINPQVSGRYIESTDLLIKTNFRILYDNKPSLDANLAYENNKTYAIQSRIYIPNEKYTVTKDSTKITSYIPDQKEMIKNYIENRKNAEKYKTRFFERSNVTNIKEHKSFRNFYLGDFERGLRKQIYGPVKNKNTHSDLNNNTFKNKKLRNLIKNSSHFNNRKNIKSSNVNQIAKNTSNVRKNQCGCRTKKKTLFEKREELRNKINIDKEAYKKNLYLKKEKTIDSNNNDTMYTIFV